MDRLPIKPIRNTFNKPTNTKTPEKDFKEAFYYHLKVQEEVILTSALSPSETEYSEWEYKWYVRAPVVIDCRTGKGDSNGQFNKWWIFVRFAESFCVL